MTATQIPYATGAQYINLTCRLGEVRSDASDSDPNPDLMSLGGTVTLTCDVPRVRYTEADGGKRMLSFGRYVFSILPDDGKLWNPTTPSQVGVQILSSMSPGLDPTGFTWTAEVVTTTGDRWTTIIPSDTVGNYDLVAGADDVLETSVGYTALSKRMDAVEGAALVGITDIEVQTLPSGESPTGDLSEGVLTLSLPVGENTLAIQDPDHPGLYVLTTTTAYNTGDLLIGSGSPEGVQPHAVPTGTIYRDTNQTTGATLWYKEMVSLTEPEWRVIGGRTPWMDVVAWDSAGQYTYNGLGTLASSFAPLSGVNGMITYRRRGDLLIWWIRGVKAAVALTKGTIVDLFVPSPAFGRGLFADDGTHVIEGYAQCHGFLTPYSNTTLGAKLQLRLNSNLAIGANIFSSDGGTCVMPMTTAHWPITLPGIVHSGTPTP